MSPSNIVCLTSLLVATMLIVANALPVDEIPDHRRLDANHPSKKWYSTSDSSQLPEQSDTRDISSTRPNGHKRYRSTHEHREMSAADLKRAARQSRKEDEASQEHQSTSRGWLTSFSRLFGFGVNEEDNVKDDNDADAQHDKIETHPSQEKESDRPALPSVKEGPDADHPADYGSEEEVHISSTEDFDSEKHRNELASDDEELLTKTDLRDLVRLFRRMFTTVEKELNRTDTAPTQPRPNTKRDLNFALAQAKAVNRKKELENKQALLQSGDEDREREEEHTEHDRRLEVPLGSPAYDSRKRVLRGLSGVEDQERAEAHRAGRPRHARADDREHFTQAISAGLLPYL